MSTTETEGRHLDHQALVIWLALVRLGGYWTARQLRDEGVHSDGADQARRVLDRLALLGMARKHAPAGKHASYGVTTACAAPPGYAHVMRGEPV